MALKIITNPLVKKAEIQARKEEGNAPTKHHFPLLLVKNVFNNRLQELKIPQNHTLENMLTHKSRLLVADFLLNNRNVSATPLLLRNLFKSHLFLKKTLNDHKDFKEFLDLYQMELAADSEKNLSLKQLKNHSSKKLSKETINILENKEELEKHFKEIKKLTAEVEAHLGKNSKLTRETSQKLLDRKNLEIMQVIQEYNLNKLIGRESRRKLNETYVKSEEDIHKLFDYHHSVFDAQRIKEIRN